MLNNIFQIKSNMYIPPKKVNLSISCNILQKFQI